MLRIGRSVPSNLFEVCIAIIVSYNVNYTSVLRPTMRQYDPTAIGYPLRRCTLVLEQGRRLALLSFLTSLTRPLSCTSDLALPHYDTRDVSAITDLPYMVVSHDLGQAQERAVARSRAPNLLTP